MIKPYFRTAPDAPPPLRRTVTRRVRFEEVDALGIVWHGRHASYIEDGRVAVCEACGIGYLTLFEQEILAPIKSMHIDYMHPLRFGQKFKHRGRTPLHRGRAHQLRGHRARRNRPRLRLGLHHPAAAGR